MTTFTHALQFLAWALFVLLMVPHLPVLALCWVSDRMEDRRVRREQAALRRMDRACYTYYEGGR